MSQKTGGDGTEKNNNQEKKKKKSSSSSKKRKRSSKNSSREILINLLKNLSEQLLNDNDEDSSSSESDDKEEEEKKSSKGKKQIEKKSKKKSSAPVKKRQKISHSQSDEKKMAEYNVPKSPSLPPPIPLSVINEDNYPDSNSSNPSSPVMAMSSSSSSSSSSSTTTSVTSNPTPSLPSLIHESKKNTTKNENSPKINIYVPRIWEKILIELAKLIEIPPIYLCFFGKVFIDKNKDGDIKLKKEGKTSPETMREFWTLEKLKNQRTFNSWIYVYSAIYTINFVLKPVSLMSKEMNTMIHDHLNTIPTQLFVMCGFVPKYGEYSGRKKGSGRRGKNPALPNPPLVNNPNNNDNLGHENQDHDYDNGEPEDQEGIINLNQRINQRENDEIGKILDMVEKEKEVEENKKKRELRLKNFLSTNGELKHYSHFITKASTYSSKVEDYFLIRAERQSYHENVMLLRYFLDYQQEKWLEWKPHLNDFKIERNGYIPNLSYSNVLAMTKEKWENFNKKNMEKPKVQSRLIFENPFFKPKSHERFCPFRPFFFVYSQGKRNKQLKTRTGFICEFNPKWNGDDNRDKTMTQIKLDVSHGKIFKAFLSYYYNIVDSKKYSHNDEEVKKYLISKKHEDPEDEDEKKHFTSKLTKEWIGDDDNENDDDEDMEESSQIKKNENGKEDEDDEEESMNLNSSKNKITSKNKNDNMIEMKKKMEEPTIPSLLPPPPSAIPLLLSHHLHHRHHHHHHHFNPYPPEYPHHHHHHHHHHHYHHHHHHHHHSPQLPFQSNNNHHGPPSLPPSGPLSSFHADRSASRESLPTTNQNYPFPSAPWHNPYYEMNSRSNNSTASLPSSSNNNTSPSPSSSQMQPSVTKNNNFPPLHGTTDESSSAKNTNTSTTNSSSSKKSTNPSNLDLQHASKTLLDLNKSSAFTPISQSNSSNLNSKNNLSSSIPSRTPHYYEKLPSLYTSFYGDEGTSMEEDENNELSQMLEEGNGLNDKIMEDDDED